jgi:hypothetical protein
LLAAVREAGSTAFYEIHPAGVPHEVGRATGIAESMRFSPGGSHLAFTLSSESGGLWVLDGI